MDTLITRKEYMAGHFTHDQFYGQFVTDGMKQLVASGIGESRIVDSICPNFNDIPLREWDSMFVVISKKHKDAFGTTALTKSELVCILKASAKAIRREKSTPKPHSVKVNYRPIGESCGLMSFDTDISGTVDGIVDYYMSDAINVGEYGDIPAKVVSVDFCY